MVYSFLLLYILLGLASGFFAGILGIGGGVLTVPFLYWFFTLQGISATEAMHSAIATSLCVMIFTSLASAFTHLAKKEVSWKICSWMAIGIVIGSFFGPLTSLNLPTKIIRIILASFEVLIGIYLFLKVQPKNKQTSEETPVLLNPYFFIPFGAVVGYVATFLGIGGGIFIVPMLLLMGLSSHKSIATSSICIVLISILGTGMYLFFSKSVGYSSYSKIINFPALVVVGISTLIASPVGAYFCYKIPNNILKKIFASLLVTIGILFFSQKLFS